MIVPPSSSCFLTRRSAPTLNTVTPQGLALLLGGSALFEVSIKHLDGPLDLANSLKLVEQCDHSDQAAMPLQPPPTSRDDGLMLVTERLIRATSDRNIRFAYLGHPVGDHNWDLHPPISHLIPSKPPVYPHEFEGRLDQDVDNEALMSELTRAVRDYSWDNQCWRLARILRSKFQAHKDVLGAAPNDWAVPSEAPRQPATTLADYGGKEISTIELVQDMRGYVWDCQRWEEHQVTKREEEERSRRSYNTPEASGSIQRKRQTDTTPESPPPRKRPTRGAAKKPKWVFPNLLEDFTSPDGHSSMDTGEVDLEEDSRGQFLIKLPAGPLAKGMDWPKAVMYADLVPILDECARCYDMHKDAEQWNDWAKCIFLENIHELLRLRSLDKGTELPQSLASHWLVRRYNWNPHFIHWYLLEIIYRTFGKVSKITDPPKGGTGSSIITKLEEEFEWKAERTSHGPKMEVLRKHWKFQHLYQDTNTFRPGRSEALEASFEESMEIMGSDVAHRQERAVQVSKEHFQVTIDKRALQDLDNRITAVRAKQRYKAGKAERRIAHKKRLFYSTADVEWEEAEMGHANQRYYKQLEEMQTAKAMLEAKIQEATADHELDTNWSEVEASVFVLA